MTAQDRPSVMAGTERRAQLSLFARNFFKHPRMLGSIIPSSPYLVRRLLEPVDWERARVIVEYGPGVGTITREILKHLHPEATLVVIETNEEFVDFLQRSLLDPRLQVISGSAETIQAELDRLGLPAADYVVAGIPFSTMPAEIRERILKGSREALLPEGSMLIYQFSPKVLTDLRQVFSAVECGFEPINIPPAKVYFCRP
ncbi:MULTISPECIES: class I SAM-dependent methyltransferase [Halomonas]|uniref:16S ribosomal RNA methyltransferase KsgA/Dim1 family protein n=1 Tax=Halomonas chromatireducens TaxID=507626 RepID=A0A109UM41_9GAMM|nr:MULTISPECIES: rRNA adenine N-6-methyltransferase family protein [Halomonas]AMD01458.1 16S ribosomal RNA methyltransferase KsgA/Dim1 family protein [Halomonas chromatireducens]MBZ0332055.1 methyltransferase [Halomonas sp. ANAO-440]